VTSTMVITSVFLFYVLRERMPGGVLAAAAVAGAFLVIDSTFFAANALKLAHGGFFPVLLAVVIVTIMTSWATGRRLLNAQLRERSASLSQLERERAEGTAIVIRKTAIFLTRELDRVPPAMTRLHRHFDVLLERAILMRVVSEPVPHVAEEDRISVETPESNLCRVVVRYGFMESPDIPAVVARLPERGLPVDPDQVVYVLGRETILATERHGMALWRERLFAFLARNAARATAFFNLPPRQVIEIGAEIDL
ncbi:MAG TPA: KUP/HAK/KT family potassium transporter, partial [Candidatus Polarisedimenticolaceae bacterium]|nr:KUP/HAK/KT family potassium transporter [Candidatus Polarisedimenticolaceae bacterium]